MKRIIVILFCFLSLNSFAQRFGGVASAGVYDVQRYGIVPGGSNQATLINSMITALPAGSTIRLERGKTYTISAPIILNKAIYFDGNGAKINYTGTASIPISIRASNVTIDNLELYGTYATDDQGDNLIGTESSSNSSFYSNITIKNCYLHDYSSTAILLRYVRNAQVLDCTIDQFPYGGILFYSVLGGLIENNTVEDITALGAPSGNCYGITVNNLSTDSTTRDVNVKGNSVSRVPWEGYDTHGGVSLTFDNNYAIDCGVGIAIVSTTGKVCNSVKVTNNTIRSLDYTASGISVKGFSSAPNLYAQVIVSGNTLIGQHIRLELTKSTVVSDNHIYQSGTGQGIYFAPENISTSVTGNHIIDVHSPGGGNTYAILFDGNNNSAQISGNTLSATTATFTNKNRYGFSTTVGSTGCKAIVGTNDFAGATLEQYRSTGQFASRFITQDGTTTAHITTSSVYSVLQTDRLILYEYTTGGTSITLPAINALNDEREIWISNLSSGTLTTSLPMYTTTSTNSTTIAAGAKVRLTYDNTAGKIWRD